MNLLLSLSTVNQRLVFDILIVLAGVTIFLLVCHADAVFGCGDLRHHLRWWRHPPSWPFHLRFPTFAVCPWKGGHRFHAKIAWHLTCQLLEATWTDTYVTLA